MNEFTVPEQETENKNTVLIERAQPDDAVAINALLSATWIATYPNEAAGITKEAIRIRVEGEHGERIPQKIERWRNTIERNDGLKAVFVARLEDKVVGLVAPGIDDGYRRVGALYVLPEAQGRGIGGRLMQKVLEWHGDEEDIHLAVASYNQNAIDFYTHFGFERTDKAIEDEGDVYGNTRIPEFEMVRRARTKS